MKTTTAALLITLAGSSQALADFPAVFELSTLNGTNGFVINGIDASDRSGWSVSSAGDVNDDGIDDVLIGAPFASPNTLEFRSGQSYVVFGGTAVGIPGTIELSALDGTDGFVINGIDESDRSGWSVSSAGDVNDDGIDDILIGAPRAYPNGVLNAGESYIIFGGATVGSGGVIELSSLNGANGFVLNGFDFASGSGGSVSSAGDVNDDGIGDIIIGASFASPNGIDRAGQSYVVFGAAGIGAGGSIQLAALNGTNGFVLNGIDEQDRSGFSVSSAGDVNGDGIEDIIIGAFYADPNGNSSAGESYIVFGEAGIGSTGTIELSSLNGTNGFVINGTTGNGSGYSVSSAGDVNGDGIDDIIIGTREASESYVVFGALGVGTGGSIELSALSGTDGFVITNVDGGSFAQHIVSSAGDVNGDGIEDFVIGVVPDSSPSGDKNYVVFGDAGIGSIGTLELSTLDGTNGFVTTNIAGSSLTFVSSAGDINGDGIDDLLIGASSASPNGNSLAGETYVIFGSRTLSPADFTADGSVDSADLAILLAAWGTPAADIGGDSTTNSVDLAILLAAWSG